MSTKYHTPPFQPKYRMRNGHNVIRVATAVKRTFGNVRPAKIQIRLRIRAVWSESSLGAFWIAKDAVSTCGQRRLWSDHMDAQANLSLLWAHMSEGTFSHVTAYMFYPFMPSGLFKLNTSDRSTSNIKSVWLVFYYYHVNRKKKNYVFNANSVDPDQTPRSAASDLSLHCLPIVLFVGR